MPDDPFAKIAQDLVAAAPRSYPVMDGIFARKVILCDNITYPSIEICVDMSYQGRSLPRHTLIYQFDDENSKFFLLTKPDDPQ
jgi:hypothetical protein